jgi:hypothetical protein
LETLEISLEQHKQFAIELFNNTWDMLEKNDRSDYDDIRMIHMAHTSLYHWSYVGEAVNMTRGEWLVSRVYCSVGLLESAEYHAHKSLSICLNNNIGDIDLAFAYEAFTRIYALKLHQEDFNKYQALAFEASKQITSINNRDYFIGELEKIQVK